MNSFDFTDFPALETERLQLRHIGSRDADAWLAVWNHPDVLRYLVDFENTTTDLDEVKEIIQWADEIFAKKSGIRWAMALKPEPTMIGSCGYHLMSQSNRCAEIGYELHHDYWRRGLMREALEAVLSFGFQCLHLHRIEANVTVGNEASAGLLRSLGFAQEGLWRDKVYARNRFYGLWQFAILENEYRSR